MDSRDPMVAEVNVVRWQGAASTQRADFVVVEEPLDIRVNDNPYAVTMRTLGDDEALAIGFLVAEGIIRSFDDVFDTLRCADPEHPDFRNVVNVVLDPRCTVPAAAPGVQRYATSSCGLCGRAAIDSIRVRATPLKDPPRVSTDVLVSLPDRLRAGQAAFDRTGGLHAAGLFDLAGNLLHAAEDVGRHNAVDKVVGRALRQGPWPLAETILMVSGRAGYEIVQKAIAARIPALCSVSAPSSLAVDLARELNLILAGFLRQDSMNIYSGAEYVGTA